jgi:hypothetical protein
MLNVDLDTFQEPRNFEPKSDFQSKFKKENKNPGYVNRFVKRVTLMD